MGSVLKGDHTGLIAWQLLKLATVTTCFLFLSGCTYTKYYYAGCEASRAGWEFVLVLDRVKPSTLDDRCWTPYCDPFPDDAVAPDTLFTIEIFYMHRDSLQHMGRDLRYDSGAVLFAGDTTPQKLEVWSDGWKGGGRWGYRSIFLGPVRVTGDYSGTHRDRWGTCLPASMYLLLEWTVVDMETGEEKGQCVVTRELDLVKKRRSFIQDVWEK